MVVELHFIVRIDADKVPADCTYTGLLIVSGGGWVQGTELGAAADGMCVTWVVGTEIWPPADTPPLLKVQTTRPPSALCFVTVLLLDGSPVSAPRVLSKKTLTGWAKSRHGRNPGIGKIQA